MIEQICNNPTGFNVASMILNVIVFLLGAYCGYRFSVRQDKRREFNAIADIVRPKIEEEMRDPDPFTEAITRQQLDDLVFYMWPWDKNHFRALVQEYHEKKETGQTNPSKKLVGISDYVDPEPIKDLCKKILGYLQKR